MRVIDWLYVKALKPILFSTSPDTVHDLFTSGGEFFGRFAPTRALFAWLYTYPGTDLQKTVDGVHYRTPIILSAGFDPDGRLTRILPSLAFGGVEVGSTTALPCEGNPLPRMTRLVKNKSLVVFKGLRNRGVDVLIKKLKATPREREFVIGISIARTNLPAASTDIEAGIEDYVASFTKLTTAKIGDYYTINISCPNAFTGETFTTPETLAKLLPRLAEVPCDKPVYLKMPISLEWEEFEKLVALAAESPLVKGLIIGNLNKHYNELAHPEEAPKTFRGGLSGTPTQKRSTTYLRRTREKYGTRFTLIGCGGILTPEDALEKLHAGADLLQLVSGMIFTGPGLMRQICERISKERGA